MLKMFKELGKLLLWSSPWGKCILLRAWFTYRESELWTYRVQLLGALPAARMLTLNEFKYFIYKVMKDKKFLKSIIYPYTKLNDMVERDVFYRKEITFLRG